MIDKESKKALRETPYPQNLMEAICARDYGGNFGDDMREIDCAGYTPSAIRAMVSESLTERETLVIEMRYRDRMTLDEAAKAFNVTRERVRQIEAKALRKLQHPGRLKAYASVPYKEWQKEHAARERAEMRLDWYLQHGDYKVELDERDKPGTVAKGVLGTTVEDLQLSVRSYNCLKRAGINTVEDILKLSEEEMMTVRNLGRKSTEEVVGKIHSLGLKMKWEQ